MKFTFLKIFLVVLFFIGSLTQVQAQTLDDIENLLDKAREQIQSLFQQNGLDMSNFSSSISKVSDSRDSFDFFFARDLESGDENEDVKFLQKILNKDPDTQLAISGLGSPGSETNFFGQLTFQAVSKFQSKYRSEVLTPVGLSNPTGYVGPSTRNKLNSLYKFSNSDEQNNPDDTEQNEEDSDNSDDNEGENNENNSNEGDKLSAPSPIRMSVGYSSVSLDWGSLEGAQYYRVKRSQNQNDYTTLADDLVSSYFNDTDVEENQTYYYYIVGVRDGDEGEKSVVVTASIPRRSGGGGDEEESATLPLTGLTIDSEGWTASTTIGSSVDGGTYVGLNSTTSPGFALTVTSKSWTTSGVETTDTRTVYATAIKRVPYPNQTTILELENGSNLDVAFALSEKIYTDDTVTASVSEGFFTDDGTGGSGLSNSAQTPTVTNNSTETYPEPQAVWLMHDRQHATTTTFSPKLLVMHEYAQQGQPVRAVKFTATDESANSASAIATSLSREQYSASGLYSNFYTAAIDLSGLDQGELMTIDATIYPWVGDSFTISTDAESYPSPNLTTMRVLNDKNDSLTVYAYVDGTGSSPAVSTDPDTASSTPYATIHAAASAIQTYNNANLGHNTVSGGVIRISENTTITGLGTDTMDDLTDGDAALVIEGANQATSIYTNAATSVNNDINNYLKFKNLTFRKNGASIIGLDGNSSGAANMLAFEDVIFDANGQNSYAAWIYRFGRGYFINTSGDYVGQGEPFSTTPGGTALALGNDFLPIKPFNAVANDVDSNITHIAQPPLVDMKGAVYAFNFIRNNSAGSKVIEVSIDTGTRGVSVIGNILEKYHSSGSPPALSLYADSVTNAATNTIEAMNTVVGQRTNILYQDTGSVAINKLGISKHSIHSLWNSKSDVFGTNSNLVGNWAFRYKVNGGPNFIDLGDSAGNSSPGASTWLGEILAVGETVTGDPDFTNDKSADGAGGGNGDYSLGAATDVPRVESGKTMFSWDLYGTAIPTDGSARAGAVQ